MKTTTVPAQVTTVEDKIAGSLTLPQLFLLIAPIFVASAIYLIIPPVMHLTIIKCAISFFIWLTGGIMAIRLKDKIVLLWLVVLIHYAVRPRYYIFNKNDMYLRRANNDIEPDQPDDKAEDGEEPVAASRLTDILTPLQRLRLETAMADPRAKLHFRNNRKGGLRVHITEVK
ncbi:MAG TPA: hypothetical protein VMR08_00935 [Patescibacteria group bacterium]|jgi:hypothetical protein|nr:hypothetical protein [Patescibacteria group bacterium]